MLNQVLQRAVGKFLRVVLQIGLCTLTPRTNRVSVVLVRQAGWGEFKEMRASLLQWAMSSAHHSLRPGIRRSTHVLSNHQETDSIRPLSVLLRVCLRTVGNALHNPRHRNRPPVQHPFLHRLLTHVIAQHPCIARQAGNGNADMVINLDKLLLVGRELSRRALEGQQDGVRFGAQADSCRALLDGFLGVFNLVQATLRRLERVEKQRSVSPGIQKCTEEAGRLTKVVLSPSYVLRNCQSGGSEQGKSALSPTESLEASCAAAHHFEWFYCLLPLELKGR